VGKEHMDAIRSQATRLITASSAQMEVSQAHVRRSLMLSRIGIAAVAMAGLLAFYLYLRQTTALNLSGEQQQKVLQQERDLLERQVRERTATLAELATHLQLFARKSAATSPANCTTNSAPCSRPPNWTWPD